MNQRERQNILINIDFLSQNIDLNENLFNQLFNKNIFTQQMINHFQSIPDITERKKRLLQDLTRRGPEAYGKFVEILFGLNQIEAARRLKPESLPEDLNRQKAIESLTSSPTDSISVAIEMALDSSGDLLSGNTVASVETEDYMVNVQKCRKGMFGPNIYKMASNPRGFTLIFNFSEFANNSYERRLGSDTEANRLRDVFQQLHFKAQVFTNQSKDQMMQTIKKYSKHEDLGQHDCLVVIVLSHGHSGYVVASDGQAIQFEDIVSKFNNSNCPKLIGRPKLLFFNCCRGDNRDSGYKLQNGEKAVNDAKAFNKIPELPKVPSLSDIMVCFSTVDGYVSWRHEENGSWFGNALSTALMRNSHDKDLHHILIVASNLVTSKVTTDGEKQTMEWQFRGWQNFFYFNPGITSYEHYSTQ